MRTSRATLRVLPLAALLGVLAMLLLLTAGPLLAPGAAPVTVPWWVLGLLYLTAGLLPAVYEVRGGDARSIVLSHFGLAIGLVFVAPALHVLVRAAVTSVDTALSRQPLYKACFNVSVASLEVAVATVVARTVSEVFFGGALTGPGPEMWATLLAAVLVSDLAGVAALQLAFVVSGLRPARDELRSALATTTASSLLFTGAGIVVVAAVWADVSTVAVGIAVALALSLTYRKHRRLAADQQQSNALHHFITALGPLDLDSVDGQAALRQARTLLQARHLVLSLRHEQDWRHWSDDEDGAPARTSPDGDPPLAGHLALGEDDQMSAPLLGSQHLSGVLRVQERTGGHRRFGLRDMRVLETLAAELSRALERGRLQRELARAATTDALTGLPNLQETTQRLDALMQHESTGVLVATLAVDSFREVNDTLGHQVGDDLLREVTRRLLLAYPEALTGRIGGGRFAVAVPARALGGDPAMFGLGLRAQVEGGAQLGPVGTHVRLSVGCVRGPEHGEEAATLIRRAETAMYSARNAGGGPVVWEPAYEVEGQRRLAVIMALREALVSGAIGVAFQPKLDTRTRAVTGVEALARWTHPALGAISPAEFVPLAEASGLMGPLTATVLRQALTSCRSWQRRNSRVGVAVNVSAETILDPSFVTEVAAIVTSVGVPPELLTLELTEGVVMDDPGLAAERLAELRALGLRISVDDFGTGYSSWEEHRTRPRPVPRSAFPGCAGC